MRVVQKRRFLVNERRLNPTTVTDREEQLGMSREYARRKRQDLVVKGRDM
jgi:hypothetical protein